MDAIAGGSAVHRACAIVWRAQRRSVHTSPHAARNNAAHNSHTSSDGACDGSVANTTTPTAVDATTVAAPVTIDGLMRIIQLYQKTAFMAVFCVCAGDRTRTGGPLRDREVLYPAKLRPHIWPSDPESSRCHRAKTHLNSTLFPEKCKEFFMPHPVPDATRCGRWRGCHRR